MTKSGGNDFRGSVYYYLQNKAFNTNEFFLKEAGVEKPQADRTETGFTIGGPLIKDQLFLFRRLSIYKGKYGFGSDGANADSSAPRL